MACITRYDTVLMWRSALMILLGVALILCIAQITYVDQYPDLRRSLKEAATTAEALPPLFPLRIRDYVGFSLASVGLIVSAGGGMGGGGILLPIYALILQLPVRSAIPHTSVTVFGGALANNLLNCNKKHPEHPHRPCIDYDLLLQLEPMAIAGALFGASLNDVLPEMVTVALLLLTLSYMAYKILEKGIKMHHQESIIINKSGTQDEAQDLVQRTPDRAYGAVGVSTSNGAARPEAFASLPSFDDIKEHQVWLDVALLTLLFAFITVVNVWKGSMKGDSGFFGVMSCGPVCFWTSQVALFLVIVLFALWFRAGLLHRLRSGGPVLSDIAWDETNTIQYPAIAIAAGIVAGLFGLGGAIVFGPMLLALGVHPAVASATSACMILFTSAQASVSFYVFGLLVFDYTVMCTLLGFVATIVGQTVMSLLLKRYQRTSYIVFCIGIVTAVSALCMTAESVQLARSSHLV